ncbi:MAG: sigma-70 family RNA polymerase sigma factor [Phycisphaerae bacterium]|nr:sigma-70 family RNA polymerase sigma factor [Phycisphaerae bacterium]
MGYSDENLIAAHLKGDPTAFRELVRRYGDGVLGYLCHMTGNRDQAEDLFQETFKRVHEKAHTFRGEGFKSWLFTIATRVTIDGARRRKRRMTISLDQETDCDEQTGSQLAAVADENVASPADELLRQEQKEQVRKAVESLPTGQRATLILAYYQQLSYREVAEALGCSVGAVKTQMSRALATLAQRLPDSIGATR